MAVGKTIFSNPFVGNRSKVANNPKIEIGFDNDPDNVIDTVFRVLPDDKKPFIYAENSQNNPENPERFFSAQKNNFNFFESPAFSQAATANAAQFYTASGRSFGIGNGSTNKYGPSGSSSFASNKVPAPLVRQLAHA